MGVISPFEVRVRYDFAYCLFRIVVVGVFEQFYRDLIALPDAHGLIDPCRLNRITDLTRFFDRFDHFNMADSFSNAAPSVSGLINDIKACLDIETGLIAGIAL